MVLFLSSEHYGIAHEDESEEGYARSDDDASCREDVGVEGVEPGRASGHKTIAPEMAMSLKLPFWRGMRSWGSRISLSCGDVF